MKNKAILVFSHANKYKNRWIDYFFVLGWCGLKQKHASNEYIVGYCN